MSKFRMLINFVDDITRYSIDDIKHNRYQSRIKILLLHEKI